MRLVTRAPTSDRDRGTNHVWTAAIVVTLALGLGATAAVLSLVDAVLLNPLPVREPERLAMVYSSRGEKLHRVSTYADYARYGADVLSELAAFVKWEFRLEVEDGPRVLPGELVSRNFFDALGTKLALGSGFSRAADGPVDTVVLSHGLWHRAFGASMEVLGNPVSINGQPYTVVGVAPPGFRGLDLSRLDLSRRPEIWMSLENYADPLHRVRQRRGSAAHPR